jgi:hypothetical protein
MMDVMAFAKQFKRVVVLTSMDATFRTDKHIQQPHINVFALNVPGIEVDLPLLDEISNVEGMLPLPLEMPEICLVPGGGMARSFSIEAVKHGMDILTLVVLVNRGNAVDAVSLAHTAAQLVGFPDQTYRLPLAMDPPQHHRQELYG